MRGTRPAPDRALATVIVTGGASGRGAAVAAAVDKAGGTPVVLDLRPPDTGFDHEVVDLSDSGATAAAVARVAERHADLAGVVTAAGTDACGRLTDVPAAYCASKFGVVGCTRALAAERAGTVGVTLLVAGGMQTAFFNDRPDQYKPGPDAKLNRSEDVAETVLFALRQPGGCEVRELVVAPSTETSWP